MLLVLVFDSSKNSLNEWVCCILWWNTYSLYGCSSWSYVWISLDRFLAIWKPSWYRLNGTKAKARKTLIIFTVLVYILMSPNILFREMGTYRAKESVFSALYSCTWVPSFSMFDKVFSEFCGGIPVSLVLLLNVASSCDVIKRLIKRRFTTKREVCDVTSQSRTQDCNPTRTRARVVNDTKISVILIILAAIFVVLVGGGNVMWHYQRYGLPQGKEVPLSRLLILVNTICYAMNGCINGFILLIFPSMRQALFLGLRKLLRY